MEDKLLFLCNGKIEELDKLCRICLTENTLQSKCLHEARPGDPSESLASMVMAVARVEIHSQDGLPDTICGDCLGELEAAHGFRLKCERSDGLLRKLYLKEPPDDLPQPTPVKEEDGATPLVKTEYDIEYEYETNEPLGDSDSADDISLKIFTKKDLQPLKKCSKRNRATSRKADASLTVKEEDGDVKNINCINSSVPQDDKKAKKKLKNVGPFICDICGRPLHSKTSLENHKLRIHTEEKKLKMAIKTGYGASRRFHCTECPFVTPKSQTMRYHTQTHTGERPYQCPQCPARFSQPGSLKSHVTRHSDVMNFMCPTCGKQFKLKDEYESHKLVHSDVRAHICNICNKGLKTKSSLNIHIKRHLNIRDYSCDQCGATFVSLDNLISHSKRHETAKNFECHFCTLKTKSKKRLVEHIKRHTSKATFKCEVCDYASVSKYSLKAHMTKHTREKKYSCPVCHLKMIHSSGVNKHMLRVHGILYKVNDHTDRRLIK